MEGPKTSEVALDQLCWAQDVLLGCQDKQINHIPRHLPTEVLKSGKHEGRSWELGQDCCWNQQPGSGRSFDFTAAAARTRGIIDFTALTWPVFLVGIWEILAPFPGMVG